MKKSVVSPGAITKANADLNTLAKSIGRVVNGNKSTTGASSGEYVVLLNSSISGRADGLYTASKAIPANTAIDSSYLTADSTGGLNALNSNITKMGGSTKTMTNLTAYGMMIQGAGFAIPLTSGNVINVTKVEVYNGSSWNELVITSVDASCNGLQRCILCANTNSVLDNGKCYVARVTGTIS